MDTQKLRAVMAAIRYKSLSKAALEFGYTPSAMTHIANSVENELGVKIINRTHSGIELTAQGETLYPRLVELIALDDKIMKESRELSYNGSNSLKIGSYASIALYVLPELLSRFKAKYPEIRISVTVASAFSDDPDADGYDVVFSEHKSGRSAKQTAFMKDSFAAVAPREVMSGKSVVNREELYDYTLIMTNDIIMDTYFDISRFKDVIRFTSADDMSVISMVKEGMGIAVLPSLSIGRREEGVRVISLDPPVYRVLTYTPNQHSKSLRALSLFLSFLSENIKVYETLS